MVIWWVEQFTLFTTIAVAEVIWPVAHFYILRAPKAFSCTTNFLVDFLITLSIYNTTNRALDGW
jgi:hypothetical protein